MLDRAFEKLAVAISFTFLITMALGCYEIIADKVFGAPTSWSYDVIIMLNAAGFLIGGAYALQTGRHITITVMRERLRGWLASVVDRLNTVIIAVYLACFSWFAFKQARNSIARGETSGHAWDGPMPQIVRALMVIGAVLLLLRVIIHLARRLPLFVNATAKPTGTD